MAVAGPDDPNAASCGPGVFAPDSLEAKDSLPIMDPAAIGAYGWKCPGWLTPGSGETPMCAGGGFATSGLGELPMNATGRCWFKRGCGDVAEETGDES